MHAARFLPYLSSRVHYYTWGSGSRLLFAFHGYGESGSSFSFLGTSTPADLAVVAIDLPFHGRTEWNEGLKLEPQQLFQIMQSIADGLSGPGSQGPWSLLGYSMGGRIALDLLHDYPDRFDRLILAAPDGMKVNPWYWIATATAFGNLLFRWSMQRPGLLFFLLRCCHALHLVNPSVYKFAVHHIDDRKVRKELYLRWTAMRHFKPGLSRIAAIVRSRQLPVALIYGRFDRIIRWERGERFRKRAKESCRLILLDAGHQLLRQQYLPVFVALL
ncbi:MAG TPA: alpha/beta fold hydrolase [Puia sp.]|nr:alpha/beta fold hydrolase [Puia sp.]